MTTPFSTLRQSVLEIMIEAGIGMSGIALLDELLDAARKEERERLRRDVEAQAGWSELRRTPAPPKPERSKAAPNL